VWSVQKINKRGLGLKGTEPGHGSSGGSVGLKLD